MPDDPAVTVRRAETVADYLACQAAQRRAWGLADESYVVPVATMVGAQHHGGLVLGAFLPGGEAVGLSFAFLGRVGGGGRLCLYSQLTGVVPGYQGGGLGFRLKAAQRDVARAEGVPCVAWAFDPLQAGNARFNLDKLGATADRYIADMYGPRTDALNRATPTDRLIAVWETAPDAPAFGPFNAAVFRETPRVIRLAADGAPDPDPDGPGPPVAPAPRLLLEVPADANRLRADRPDLAARWASAVRQGFLAAFGAGYCAVGFVRDDATGSRRCAYVLEPGARA
jgi:predicted GNAT superfamily acetyltransferase